MSSASVNMMTTKTQTRQLALLPYTYQVETSKTSPLRYLHLQIVCNNAELNGPYSHLWRVKQRVDTSGCDITENGKNMIACSVNWCHRKWSDEGNSLPQSWGLSLGWTLHGAVPAKVQEMWGNPYLVLVTRHQDGIDKIELHVRILLYILSW